MDENLNELIEGLIAQNHRLGQRQIAMECLCSAILAQLALLSPEPDAMLDRFNSEMSGTAMGVAASCRAYGMPGEYDTTSITATIETIADLSEKTLAAKYVKTSVPAWA